LGRRLCGCWFPVIEIPPHFAIERERRGDEEVCTERNVCLERDLLTGFTVSEKERRR
jgi:hypothetical protein